MKIYQYSGNPTSFLLTTDVEEILYLVSRTRPGGTNPISILDAPSGAGVYKLTFRDNDHPLSFGYLPSNELTLLVVHGITLEMIDENIQA